MKNNFTLLLFLAAFNLFAQQTLELLQPPRRIKLIDKIEIFAGPSLYFPDDHGWAEHTYAGSRGLNSYKINSEFGYVVGVGLIQSIGKRIELQGRIALEKRRYSETYKSFDFNGVMWSESKYLQKNDYQSFSIVPTYYVSKTKRLHFFAGATYYYLKRSREIEVDPSSGAQIGAAINTIGGYKPHLFDAVGGIGYAFPLVSKFEVTIRTQGNYAMNYTSNVNNQKVTVHSISIALAIRYIR